MLLYYMINKHKQNIAWFNYNLMIQHYFIRHVTSCHWFDQALDIIMFGTWTNFSRLLILFLTWCSDHKELSVLIVYLYGNAFSIQAVALAFFALVARRAWDGVLAWVKVTMCWIRGWIFWWAIAPCCCRRTRPACCKM